MGKREEPVVFGPNNIGPVDFTEPGDRRITSLIIVTASGHPSWGPLRVYEELLDAGTDLTEANVHWVMREHRLASYSTLPRAR
jgi:hypothetical protein